jgi:hypothetical protein
MFRIISKRELLLYAAQLSDMKTEIQRLNVLVEHERKRAEGAINLLLMRTVKAAITPQEGLTIQEEEDLKAKTYDIFGDGEELSEKDALEKLQGGN